MVSSDLDMNQAGFACQHMELLMSFAIHDEVAFLIKSL